MELLLGIFFTKQVSKSERSTLMFLRSSHISAKKNVSINRCFFRMWNYFFALSFSILFASFRCPFAHSFNQEIVTQNWVINENELVPLNEFIAQLYFSWYNCRKWKRWKKTQTHSLIKDVERKKTCYRIFTLACERANEIIGQTNLTKAHDGGSSSSNDGRDFTSNLLPVALFIASVCVLH